MRVAIATRIFSPEPSAASFRLEALAEALTEAGHEVTVYTVRAPKHMEKSRKTFLVKRFPVLRDRNGYVRGYVQYMSFDIPLFFRMLFTKKFDAIVAEPPPTTGLVTRFVSALKRIPYFYYAADIWSDAASQATNSKMVLGVLNSIERLVFKSARGVFSVSEGVSQRLDQLGISENVHTVGNGIDTQKLPDFDALTLNFNNDFVYAGTASEWHGASIFVDALKHVVDQGVPARISFIGGGSEVNQIQARARELQVEQYIDFHDPKTIEELYPILANSVACLGSLKPNAGYDFAFPTKLYTAAMAGAPLIFTGVGPATEFVNSLVAGQQIGVSSEYDSKQVATHMLKAVAAENSATRRYEVASWARQNFSLRKVADSIKEVIEQSVP